jgi:NAD(P)-dependent dehydrogenase (short-subunit alcohol dehydrogenase family)
MGLEGRCAVVTGGGSGMGLAISQRLARDGASLAVFDVNAEAAERAAKQIQADGFSAVGAGVDVSDRGQIQLAMAKVREALGPIQVLVNCAGISPFESFQSISEESWDRVLAVNLKGAFLCTQAVIDDMIDAGWGRIVNIASSGGQSGAPRMAHYVSSKAGMMGFTKALAVEFARSGITVNCVPPGTIDTPMLRGAVADGDTGNRQVKEIGASLPVGRIGTGDDIAAAVAFFVSEEAGYITGQILGVNGGRYM